MYYSKKQLERQVKRIRKKLEHYDVEDPSKEFTYWGGLNQGQLLGKVEVYEDILDMLEEKEND